MRYVAAYMLSALSGKENPSETDLEAIITSAGIDCEKDRAALVLSLLKGKNLEQLMAEGAEYLATLSLSGDTPVEQKIEVKREEKKEEKKEEKESESESDDGGGFGGMFDSD